MEQSVRYAAGMDPFGKGEENGDEGSPGICSHGPTVAVPNKKNFKTCPLKAYWSKSREICLNKMNE